MHFSMNVFFPRVSLIGTKDSLLVCIVSNLIALLKNEKKKSQNKLESKTFISRKRFLNQFTAIAIIKVIHSTLNHDRDHLSGCSDFTSDAIIKRTLKCNLDR